VRVAGSRGESDRARGTRYAALPLTGNLASQLRRPGTREAPHVETGVLMAMDRADRRGNHFADNQFTELGDMRLIRRAKQRTMQAVNAVADHLGEFVEG